jgi:hypothetical protein
MSSKLILTVCQCLFLGLTLNAAEEVAPPPPDLAQWELICLCTASLFTPHPIVALGNNGEILYQARSGLTRAELKGRGVACSDRQLKVLEACGLVELQGDQVRTSIPVLGPADMLKLRGALKRQVRDQGPPVKAGIQELIDLLSRQGYADQAYAIVFSYLLDGKVWDRFKAQGLMPAMAITPEHPFWDGTFYAVYPVRAHAPGTNVTSKGAWSVAMTWTKPVLDASDAVGFSGSLDPLVEALAAKGDLAASPAAGGMRAQGLLDPNSRIAIPVIRERDDDPIYAKTQAIATLIAKDVLATLRAPHFMDMVKTNDPGKALVITYHEYLWEILNYLDEEKVLQAPAILQAQGPVKAAELHHLVYLVEGAR